MDIRSHNILLPEISRLIILYLDITEDRPRVDVVYLEGLLRLEKRDNIDKAWLAATIFDNKTGLIPIQPGKAFQSKGEWWTMNGKFHRDEKDLPAVITSEGTREWWKEGKRHRIGKPAIIGGLHTEWWFEGKKHCDTKGDDGKTIPASILFDDNLTWYKHGEIHRDDLDDDGNILPAQIFLGVGKGGEYALRRYWKRALEDECVVNYCLYFHGIHFSLLGDLVKLRLKY